MRIDERETKKESCRCRSKIKVKSKQIVETKEEKKERKKYRFVREITIHETLVYSSLYHEC